MKKLGRFTKGEILEAEARFLDGQSLYKIGKNMRRSQYAIRGHLINLGLIEYEPVIFHKEEGWLFNNYFSSVDILTLSILLIVLPSLGLYYMVFLVFKAI